MIARAIVLSALLMWGQAKPAQKATQGQPGHVLRGLVVNLESGSPDPVGDAALLIVTTNGHTSTNSDGEFLISMPESMYAGEEIQITVKAMAAGKELRLFQPLDGRLRLPADPSKEVLTIAVLPKGSRRFLSDDAIEALIKYANEKGQQDSMSRTGSVGQFDLSYFLDHWGKEQGLEAAEVAKRVSAWADSIAYKPTATLEEKALAEFTKHNFEDAGRMFAEAGDDRMKRLADLREREKKEEEDQRRAAIEDYKQSGSALFNGNHCFKASQQYEKAIGLTDAERDQGGWVALQILQGNSFECAAALQSVQETDTLLERSIDNFRRVLKVEGIEQHPQVRALAEQGLARSLADQSLETEGAEGSALLAESLSMMQSALAAYTQPDSRDEWASLQSDIGKVYHMQAERSSSAQEQKLLDQSEEAYQNALGYYTRKDFPQDWSHIQIERSDVLRMRSSSDPQKQEELLGNAVQMCEEAVSALGAEHSKEWAVAQATLAITIYDQAKNSSIDRKGERLDRSLAVFQQALTVLTREEYPQQWAATMANLGAAWREKGELSGGKEGQELLKKSHDAYTAALEICTRKTEPAKWAAMEENLATTLQLEALNAEGEQAVILVNQAVEAYRNSLQVATREQYPVAWARTQNKLGIALYEQDLLVTSDQAAQSLGKAVEAYRNAIGILNQKNYPDEWADIQTNLGDALLKQAKKLQEPGPKAKALSQALEAFQCALQFYDRQHFPEKWAETQAHIGDTLQEQGNQADKAAPEQLERALAAYQNAQQVYTRQQFREEWASAQVEIGNIFATQAEASQGETARALLEKAIKTYQEAIAAYSGEQSAQSRAKAQLMLGTALATEAAQSSPAEAHDQYRQAAEAFSAFLEVYPDVTQVSAMQEEILHDRLFEYQRAFEMNERRLKEKPDDVSAAADFVEKHLTTGRYSACIEHASQLLQKLPADSQLWAPVGAVRAACELGAGHQAQALSTLTALEDKLRALSGPLSQNWSFEGSKHFIQSDSTFAAYRHPLLNLLAALESHDIEACRNALRALIAAVRPRAVETSRQFPASASGHFALCRTS